MSIGVYMPIPAYYVDPAFMARKAEELGFESIWCAEHPIMPVHTTSRFPGNESGEIPEVYAHFVDPFIALARASGATTNIKLGTSITLITERNPLLMAKEISTLDVFSKGRFIFGIGTGWLREETNLMGGDFDHRWSQARDSIAALKELWTKDEAEYHGRYYDFPPVKVYPKPVQKPHPPIMLGGMASNVLKRVVTWADGWMPNRVTAARIEEARREIEALAGEVGRDPASINISVFGQPADPALVQSFLDAGADRVIISPPTHHTDEAMGEELERTANLLLK